MAPFNYKTEYQRYKKYYQSLTPQLEKPTGKRYTAVIFSFLAISLFGWYAIRPTVQTILYLKREISDKVGVNKQMEEKITALIEAQALYQEAQPLLPALEQALSEDPAILSFAVQVKNLATQTGVTVTGLQTAETPIVNIATDSAAKKPIAFKQVEIPVTVSTAGSYEQTKAFLTGLQTMRRLGTITSIALTPGVIRQSPNASDSAQVASSVVQLQIQMTIYYLAPM